MVKIVSSKNRRKRRGLKIFLSVILLAAAGAVLYGIPPSLLDISRIIQSAAGKIPRNPAGPEPAVSVLRGAIYDQRFNEMAVSYRLYRLSVRPADVADHKRTAESLAQVIDKKAAEIEGSMKSSRQTVALMEDLDEQQAAAIEALELPGVLCTPIEARFYPAHTAASHVLGFMGDNAGLAGVEGRYDAVLSSRTVRSSNIPDIDFQGRESLGAKSVDLILTLDLRLQRQLEQLFREYLTAQDMEGGMGLLLEPGSGRILALVNQPSFNPNYFWKANEGNRVNRIYNHLLDKDLIRPILVRAAEIERQGIDGPPLLPETVAMPDYGFSNAMLDNFEHRIRLYDSVSDNWEGGSSQKDLEGADDAVTGVQVGATLASLVNGGWRINPYVVDSIYDHASSTRFYRKNDGTGRAHVLDPALSVKVRRNLFANWVSDKDNKVLYLAETERMGTNSEPGEYSVQRLFAGLTPAVHPQFLLVMAVEKTENWPQPKGTQAKKDTLHQLGRDLLTYVEQNPPQLTQAEAPPARSEENMRQFFISKRLATTKTPEEIAAQAAAMPALRGLSLRKALQKIDPYKLKVSINGSGKVIAQYPLPGVSLLGMNECILTLDER